MHLASNLVDEQGHALIDSPLLLLLLMGDTTDSHRQYIAKYRPEPFDLPQPLRLQIYVWSVHEGGQQNHTSAPIQGYICSNLCRYY